jgi:hypothetical protein
MTKKTIYLIEQQLNIPICQSALYPGNTTIATTQASAKKKVLHFVCRTFKNVKAVFAFKKGKD